MVKNNGRSARLGISAAVIASLVITLAGAPAAGADELRAADRSSWSAEERRAHGQTLWPDRDDEKVIPSQDAPPVDKPARAPRTSSPTTPVEWPEGGAATVDVPISGEPVEAELPKVPVTVAAVPDEEGQEATGDAPPTEAPVAPVEVAVADRDATKKADVDGLLLSVEPAAEGDVVGTLEVSIDYSGFAGAFGGDWASRLQVVSLPDCDLASPGAGCGEQVALESTNDATAGVVTARVAPAAMGVLAVTAGTSGSTGNWSATSLSPSATWQVSEQTGDFVWSYPMAVPAGPGGPEPELALSYSSGAVDGRVSSTNNQSSWIGDGWDLGSGYVERKYVACADDMAGAANNASRKTGDLCWQSDNATLALNGGAVELVKDAASGAWKPKKDDGTKIERLTGSWNAGQNGEYWKVTTSDGTQYFFGRDKRSAADTASLNSAWTVPVFGNHPGDPCYQAAFANSSCNQVWRWNLDYVVDPGGNSLTYTYAKETNSYGRNLNTAVSSYDRGGYLVSIDYGQRAGAEATKAPARVEFTVAERCLPSGSVTCDPAQLTTANAAKWPDVPFDLICTSSSTCPQQVSPAFFTRKRLTTVTTKVLDGSTYRSVDSWTLGHQFPDPGDGTDAVLWLASIERTGHVGTAVTLPKVTFVGEQKANRVDTLGDIGPAMNRYRIIAINTESGGTVSVNYTPQDCTSGNTPAAPESNTRRCFPVFWDPEGGIGSTMEYFHKYLVSSIVASGNDSQSQATVTSYSYVGDAAWHYDDNALVPVKQRTWGQFRGYATVDVTTGDSTTNQLKTRSRFFRGMNGDRANAAGGAKSVSVDGIVDHDWFNGMTREEIVFDGAAEVSGTLSVPWASGVTATGADGTSSRYVGIETVESRTTAPALAGGKRTTRTVTSFDQYGMPTQVDDQGDVSSSADDQCTRTEYNRNVELNILSTVMRTETVAKNCATAPSRPVDVIGDVRSSFDGGGYGAAPTKGLVTRTEHLKAYAGATPQYVATSTSTYDVHGRVTKSTDALGRTTTTSYTPATGGPVTKTTTTSPDPDGSGPLTAHTVSTDVEPLRGTPVKVTDASGKVTSGTYDALGRLTQVWQPGRVQGTDTPSAKYTYKIVTAGSNAVTSESLIHDGTYQTSVALFDGLLRSRQTQAPSASRTDAGRVVTDTIYDSRGLATTTNAPWYTTGAPATTTVVPTTAVPARTKTTFDGAGRPTSSVFQVAEQDRWRTTTTYGGDRVSVDPPAGAVPTTTISDARGRTTSLLQYTGAGPTGTSQATNYTYDQAGRLTKVVDPAGNQWTYGYDLRGLQTSATDPDKGTTTSTYDDAGQLLTTTDARGVVLASVYDQLGRKTELRESTDKGTLRSSWVYDTLAKGLLTSSTRHEGASKYVTAVTGYDPAGRPLGQAVTLPAVEGVLAGTHKTEYTYTVDGQVKTTKYPAAGALGAETVTTYFDNRSVPEWMAGGIGWGVYVAGSQYSPYGEPLVLDLGSGKSQMLNFSYEHGTRRADQTWLQREDKTTYDLDISYAYDDAGNITSIADAPPGKPADTQCFAYDALRRLTEAWTPKTADCGSAGRTVANLGGPAPYWTSYTHDLVGNRTTSTQHTSTGDRRSTYAYPAAGANQPHALKTVTHTASAPTAPTTDAYTYDAAGNLLTRNLAGEAPQTLTWDAEGKLDSLKEGTEASDEYIYSADGQRLVRHQDGVTTVYLPGGQELKLTGSTITGMRYYSFAGKTVASRTANGSAGVRTLISDHHATAEISINNSTNQLTRRYHDPYGNPRGAAASTWVGDRGFLNKPTDSTGLTQVGARYYDAQTGRFISVDPLMDLTDPQQWNGYAYSNNNPTTYSDPTGLIYCGRVDYRDCNQAYEYNSRTGIGTVHKPKMGISNTFIVNPSQYREHRRQELKLQPAKNRLFKQYRRTALDAAGMIPGPVGMAADGYSMYRAARERDVARFTESAASFLPIGGDIYRGFKIGPAVSRLNKATRDLASQVPNPAPVYKPNGAPDRSSPWYVGYRDADGNLQTVGNLDGVHTEIRIQERMPGVQMSRPFGWRTLDPEQGPEWVEGTVCGSCQILPESLFPPGTRGAPGGPWGHK
ncbi:RHS repeat-associated core domain-containing protein [Oerskovia rustica]|uniref:RHS repeat-associated core domain-containing protein n=1 Tax=Oerskovia rustica TaxID=2762237 RepID=A0ABR8RSM3_9CELL|nr:RHS repeat-associated core domain-containing protein [Oerskovia rustica]MBD7950801.1 hypothetical protein [Oerskovia rustica]